MKTWPSNCLYVITIFLFVPIPFFAFSQNNFRKTALQDKSRVIAGSQPQSDSGHIREARFIQINGIEQWITIKGEDRSKPAILFLHGGPGSPLCPYADAIYRGWEKDFILVQWDQRGAGKTFGKNGPEELDPAYLKSYPLRVEQMVSDGIALTEYLTHYLGKQKVILFGTSWGSVLGVFMAIKRPDLFFAYIGHSQVVNPSENLEYDYHKVYQMAEKAGDVASMNSLRQIGPPPYDTARNAGRLFRVIKKYEKENSTSLPDSLFKLSPGYDNKKDERDRSNGDDYSFANYVGDKRLDIKPMMSSINFTKDGLDFQIPVYLIQGEEDILTAKEITRAYFDMIRAPEKEFFIIPGAAHAFNLSVLERQYEIMKTISCP
jgi:pimeloyl-ACP methyl ester carboxylesterase